MFMNEKDKITILPNSMDIHGDPWDQDQIKMDPVCKR